MHFSAARAFVRGYPVRTLPHRRGGPEQFAHVFQNFVEYNIDYTKPFTENQGWTPIDNWSYLGTKDLQPLSLFGGATGTDQYGLLSVATLSNSRTYAIVSKQLIVSGNRRQPEIRR